MTVGLVWVFLLGRCNRYHRFYKPVMYPREGRGWRVKSEFFAEEVF
jgi:hypothetical protein